MHIKSEKAKKTTKYTLFSTQELTENNQRPINKAQKVMTIHIINNVRVPYISVSYTHLTLPTT